jgi:ligand-binding sensor domain-containing protein/two-component sensor histidine kinase
MILGGKTRAVVILHLLALAFLLVAPVAECEQLPIKLYTTDDGLANNAVYRIVRDSRGFLWFCTFEGLSRFDGYGFRTFSVEQGLPSPVVNDLLETREGVYWVATAAGLCRFNPKGIAQPRLQGGGHESTANAMFTVYFPDEDARSRNVTHLLEDAAGTIWCGTPKGLYRVEQENGQVTIRPIDLGMPIGLTTLIEDRRGALWIGSGEGIYRRLADGRVEHFHKPHGLPGNIITSLLEDREGRIWVGTTEGGLCRLVSHPDPARWVVARAYTKKDGLPTMWIFRLFQASDGSLWAGSNQGLIRLIPTADGRDFRFRVYAKPHGLSHDEITSLAEDRNGNLWVGVFGAAKIARSGITAFGEADGLSFYPNSILKNQAGELLVMEVGGPLPPKHKLNRFDGERFTQVELRIPGAIFHSWGWNQLVLEDHKGDWWVGTKQGVYRFPKVDRFEQLAQTPPKAVYLSRSRLADNIVLRLFEDSRGDIWIAAPGDVGGLSRWERASETLHHYTAKDGLPFFAVSYADSYVISFAEDRAGALWIGFSSSGGLVRYRDGRFTLFTANDGLPAGSIRNLFVDSVGRLWVPTTRGGLCRIDNPEAEHPTFSTYTTADGLASNSVKCVTEDHWGRIYLGTGRGIDRLDTATGHIRHYTIADGLLLGDPEAALQSSEGALWFTFPTGVVRLVPVSPSPPLPPPILITGLTVAGGARPISALGENGVASVELRADENQLQIDFVALGFSPGEGLRYQYKLEGSSEAWSPLTELRTVNFNLAPGRYRFLVRAVNADGAMSETPASLVFTILPPVWQRWWFMMLASVLVGLLAYSLYRYRLGRLLELERVRTRIASDLHDDIGANLTRIAILSEVAHAQLHDDKEGLETPLSSIAQISRESVSSMSDIVWAINPKRDHLLDLVQRMRKLASEIFAGRKIEYEFLAPESDVDLRLEADVRRNVFLIFKEAINNAARHSGCANVEIALQLKNSMLVLRVEDDGKGFDPNASNEGNGLLSMGRRAKNLGGELHLHSIIGRGTKIGLKVPHR